MRILAARVVCSVTMACGCSAWGAVPVSGQAQAGGDPETTLSAACGGPEHRQFDYWLGSWVVRSPEGVLLGRNEVAVRSDGCAVQESWTSARGPGGTSINFFDPATGRWNQVWVGGGGTILRLEGGLEGGVMTLSGSREGPNGEALAERIRWIPLDDGRIEQLWESRPEDSTEWQVVFRGMYERAR